MQYEWARVQISELVASGDAILQTGPFGSQLHKHDYVERGVAIIPTEAIGRGAIRPDALTPQVSEAKAIELVRHKLRQGDILFARRGVQATGLSAVVGPDHQGALCGTGAILLRVNHDVMDPHFLAAFLATDEAYDWLRAHAVGAVMPNLNSGIIGKLTVPRPGLNVQREIAAVSQALSCRIDLLRQTNATLESIAQALFKSWFIDFDPVRAKAEGREPEGTDAATAALFPAEFEESVLGLIPKGWRIGTLTDAFEVNPNRKLNKGTDAKYLEMATAPTSGHRPLERVGLRSFGSGCKFQNGDALLARITPCLENGKSAFVDFLEDTEVGWGSTEFIVLRSKPLLPKYAAYLMARHEPFRKYAIQAMTGTSGRQRVELSRLLQYPMALPPDASIALALDPTLSALQCRIAANDSQAKALADLRDTLLPRLISGKFRLPEVQVQLEDALA